MGRLIFVLFIFLATPVLAKTIEVAPGPDAEEQLQEAMILAEAGDEIVLAAGRYPCSSRRAARSRRLCSAYEISSGLSPFALSLAVPAASGSMPVSARSEARPEVLPPLLIIVAVTPAGGLPP